ncbi:right-handed parallel beta-helix repeat-containing protein [Psychromonas aquimarina]|uniref:right-handed parallel beta-helix repeat-containing protein n=1 Tax=Psychromonas aquimarina TaxID=444919 RepID=UPI000421B17A|nr:right-handed parallel beta-helix repeat-containing protein [Psychromonas aquimarina]
MNLYSRKATYSTVLFFLLFSSQIISAYQVPIGIPESPINFEQAPPPRAESWTANPVSETHGYYYINFTTGSDSRQYGTPLTPRRTIPFPIPAGSYIEIDGRYANAIGGVIKMNSMGTDDTWAAGSKGPVWITSAPGKEGSFEKYKALAYGSNLFISNMIVQNNSSIQIGSMSEGYGVTNIVVRDSEFIGDPLTGNVALLSAVGHQNSSSTNVILYNNVIRDLGDIYNPNDVDATCIGVSGYTSYVWILNNKGFNASGPGLQINAMPPRTASHNIYAGDNEFYNVRQSGMWVKYASNVVFSSNYVHNIISTPWSPAKAMGAQYEPNGLWMINNKIHDTEYGIRIPSTNAIEDTDIKVYMIGNVIYNIHTESPVGTSSAWESAGIHIQGAQERYIYNNLIFNTPNGINISSTSGMTDIKNNIILKVDANHTTGQGYQIWSEHHQRAPELLVSNNFFGTDEMSVQLNKTNFATTLSLDAHLNAGTTSEVSTNFSGPVDVAQIDLEQIALEGYDNSRLWDFGKDMYPELSTTLSELLNKNVPIDSDFLRKERVLGSSVDIGPFEQQGTNSNIIIPEKPGNVQIILQ